MDQHPSTPKGTSPWDILPVSSTIYVDGRRATIVARHYLFAYVRYDGDGHACEWVPLRRCMREPRPALEVAPPEPA